jgi:hypothetical protein
LTVLTFQAVFSNSQALIAIFRAFMFPLCSRRSSFRLCFLRFPSPQNLGDSPKWLKTPEIAVCPAPKWDLF